MFDKPYFTNSARIAVLSGFVFTTLTANAHAIELGAHIGTGGLGLNGTFAFNQYLTTSAYAERLKLEVTTRQEVGNDPDVAFNNKADFSTGSLNLNLHPFGNGFRLSSGVTFGKPAFSGTTVYNSNAVTNNDGIIHYSLQPERKVSPYAGLGYTSRVGQQGMFFSADAGALYVGSYSGLSTVDLSCGAGDSICSTEQNLAQSEAEKEMQRIASEFPNYYPLIRLSLGYRF